MIKKRKIPMRICVGCREQKPKKELVRIVRTPEQQVVLDLTGKKAGRGAYICPTEECFRKAVKGKRLEKSLDVPFSSELAEEISALLRNNTDSKV
jgi:uncharacterized protein